MKKIPLLTSILFLFLMVTGCGSKKNDPTPTGADKATFKVEYSQSGDFDKFIKIITIGGGDFVETGTTKAMPTVLSDSHLSTTSIYSYEAKDVVELNIKTKTGFRAALDGPASMTMKFTIYKNNIKIDEKSFTYDEKTTNGVDEHLNYKAR
ncbi:hypothetical protein [Rufibacter sp. XAAS-G3-1]|uniref:beta-barrel fold lipoprotein n=1 Tax=Rufibacter sp. XAAS-G3-1 TaxID=2729134 RepID=UPI0015E74676|nr:hypothetical protein [Rufibacter sp. XAAS-G3-1]